MINHNDHILHLQEQLQRGVDPGVLAAQLQDIQERMSPSHPPSHTSSRQDLYYTPDMSSPVLSDDVIPVVASMLPLTMTASPLSSNADTVHTTDSSSGTISTVGVSNEKYLPAPTNMPQVSLFISFLHQSKLLCIDIEAKLHFEGL